MVDKDMAVVILCGGLGSRLREETTVIPKPMVPIGDRPILWHLMKYYSAYGYTNFILCLGYKSEAIKNYFLNYRYLSSSFTINVNRDQKIDLIDPVQEKWNVACIDTGVQTMTGARLKRVEKYLNNHRFMLTYGDGLGNVDLDALLRFHESHGNIGTVTGVHPPSRFGSLHIEGTQVLRFAEKPQTEHDYINGGFFIFEPEFLKYVEMDEHCVLERNPLEKLALDGQLQAFRHDGYWQCMDTIRDRDHLEEQWATQAPWKIW